MLRTLMHNNAADPPPPDDQYIPPKFIFELNPSARNP
jgi:hypothetical protein